MIYAEHKKWADWIFYRYLNQLLKKHFYAIHVLGDIPAFSPQQPLLLLPNHSSWWDGFFIYILNKKILQRTSYIMMLEEQLAQNSFFRYIGAYSIDPHSYKGLKESLDYTQKVIHQKDSPKYVCIFPQGELTPFDEKSVKFKNGIGFILKRITIPVTLCFVGIEIFYLNEQRPEVFLKLLPYTITEKPDIDSISTFEKDFSIFLQQLKQDVLDGVRGQTIFQGKESINNRKKR